ncbi:hypothetical protein CAter282_4200 [Collimonas arenae]|uniref:Uncharacterized protein n=1 Tax=Collimonas arenae TaxID=279058 RepID=A0A127QP25_9BURK|nr:hypothetical protein CAter10_4573 [Collimonas arenae]AMP11860.1 hypothetical protein CAter282_4200 [Collimonas arenae]
MICSWIGFHYIFFQLKEKYDFIEILFPNSKIIRVADEPV